MRYAVWLAEILVTVQLASVAAGQVVLMETFADNDLADATPITWVPRHVEGGSYEVTSGRLALWAGPDGLANSTSLSVDPVELMMADTSVIAQVSGSNVSSIGLGARWNESERTGYFAGISSVGALFIGKCQAEGDCPVLQTTPSSGLNPEDEDVMLQFLANGPVLSATAWRPGEAMPTEPMITVTDPEYTVGTPAVFADPAANGAAYYEFITVAEPVAYLPEGRFVNARPIRSREVNLAGGINDGSPAVSQNGLEMIFRSNRNDVNDLYRTTRETSDDSFGIPEPLDSLNVIGAVDHGPNLSSDELTLYFSSDRTGGSGAVDLYQATRASHDAPFENVINLGAPLNTDGSDLSPNISADGLELFFASDRDGGFGDLDVWVARRDSVDEPFGEPENLGPNINSPYLDGTPTLSSDGLHLLLLHQVISNGELFIASRPSVDAPFGPRVKLDEFSLGSLIHSTSTAETDPWLTADWPQPGSKIYYTRYTSAAQADLWEASWTINGDTNGDFVLDVEDIDRIVRSFGRATAVADVNADGTVDEADLEMWVRDLKGTYFGDANLDGEFNSADLTLVFQAGEYEGDLPRNSYWDTGDWNGDREFDTADLVVAFQDGGFEQGPRQAVVAVPEPNTWIMALAIVLSWLRMRRSPR